jgi:hypothetical protein
MFNCAICQKANTDKLVGHVVHGALIHGNDKKRIVELEAQLQALRELSQAVVDDVDAFYSSRPKSVDALAKALGD